MSDIAQKEIEAASELFRKTYNAEPEVIVAAPGRVNLIGEHTDYNDGFVFPMALERNTVIVARKNNTDSCNLISGQGGSLVTFPARLADLKQEEPFWANYVKGTLKQMEKTKEGEAKESEKIRIDAIPGFDAAVFSSVPLGGGLSSSASLEVATYTLAEALTGQRVAGTDKALACQRAEHEWAGVPCGIMDQYISALGEKDHALLIDCRSLGATQVPIQSEAVILITNSNVKHSLTGSEYPQRRQQCEEASKVLAGKYDNVKNLRDCNMEQLDSVKDQLDPIVYRRARHVIGENQRCMDATEALRAGKLARFGELMVASHNSLRDDFEVSCPELDQLVELAVPVEGVFGSRMTGGGFGGCTVTLLKAEAVDACIAAINKGYKGEATCFVSRPGPGARIVKS
eukprot:Nk52_evm3s327 gene=Nk52_evmTU3s327